MLVCLASTTGFQRLAAHCLAWCAHIAWPGSLSLYSRRAPIRRRSLHSVRANFLEIRHHEVLRITRSSSLRVMLPTRGVPSHLRR
jgi:hypothetical protein